MSHVLNAGKLTCRQGEKTCRLHCAKRWENEPFVKARKRGSCSKWRENKPNGWLKQKLERDFVESQSLSTLVHEVIS